MSSGAWAVPGGSCSVCWPRHRTPAGAEGCDHWCHFAGAEDWDEEAHAGRRDGHGEADG